MNSIAAGTRKAFSIYYYDIYMHICLFQFVQYISINESQYIVTIFFLLYRWSMVSYPLPQ